MADRRLAGVKTLLRSVLQSVKEGVPARRISGDYHGITGEPLPYRALGYQSVEALMAAIPDTVRESWENGERVYKAVADQSTAHIEKMVSRQKSKQKRTKGGSGYMRRPMVYIKRGVRNRTYDGRPPYSGMSTYNNYSRPPTSYPSRSTSSYARPAYTTPTGTRPSSKFQAQTFSFGGSESGFTAVSQKGTEPSVFTPRNVNKSPLGTVRITFQPSPSPPNKQVSSRLPPNQTMNTSHDETVKFGESYKVPPRFQRIMQTQTSPSVKVPASDTTNRSKQAVPEVFEGSHRYVTLLEAHAREKGLSAPRWDTMPTNNGFVSLVTILNQTHGGGGIYKSQEDAKQSAAQAACRSLRCIKGDPLYSPRNGTAHSKRYTEAELSKWQKRIKEILQRRQNGLWCSRLPVEYKDKYKEDLPSNIEDLLQEWPDVVDVQGKENLKILYPVSTPAPTSGLSTPPWRKGASPTLEHSAAMERLSIASATQPAKGTTVDIYICYVVDAGEFYVHLKDTSITKLTNDINELAEKSAVLRRDQLSVGGYVAARCHEDQYWYRAKIITPKAMTTQVKYIDFGNCNGEELPPSWLRQLPQPLYKYPVQAVRCSLPNPQELLSDQTTEELNALMDTERKMTVIENQDDVCTVELCDSSGKKLFEPKPPKATDPEPLELPTESQWDVIVTHIATANQVVLRLVDPKYSEKLEALETMIAKNVVDNTGYTPEVGDLCAAVITSSTAEEDNPYYRVRITHIENDNARCECLDYGDSEVVPLTNLRPLQPAEAELPYQAVVAYLTGLDGQEHNEAVVKELTRMVLSRACVADVNSRDGDPSVTLYDTATEEDININEVITEVLNVRDLKPALPKDDDMAEAFVSYIEVDGSIHLQLQGPGLVKLESLTKKVTGVYSKGGAEYFVHNLQEGRLVMSLLGESWYRAIIRRILPNRQVLVVFVDYGNEEVLQCTSLRELEVASTPLYNLPHQAVPVTLDQLPPPGHTWTPNAVGELSDRVPEDIPIFVQTVQPASGQELAVVRISHFIDAEFISINDEMLDPVLWLEPAPESGLNITSSSEGEISDASVASQQANDILDEAKGLFQQLGMVTDMGDANNMFLLAGEVSETLRITESPCSITDGSSSSGVESSASPVSSASGKDLNCNDTVVVEQKDKTAVVKCNNTAVVKRLTAEEYSRLPSPPNARLPTSGSEVLVTWVSDPSDFTFVVSKELDASEEMMNKMAVFYYQQGDALKVDDPKKGEIYAALYDDERWYRVRIKNIVNSALLGKGTMVSALLVDFGSFNLLPATALRQLTPEFRKAPVNAIKATLAGVSPEAGIWSEEAVARTEELILERTFVAQIQSEQLTPVPVTLADMEAEGDEPLIHKRLIAEGLAVSSPMAYTST